MNLVMDVGNDNSRKQNTSSRSRGPTVAQRTIAVHASGEVVCKPDIFSLAISVTSTKESAETAQTSVKRRSEYILQVLRNNGVKERRVEKSTDLIRVSEDEVCVRVDYRVDTDSLQACETCRNLLVVKMDSTVQCSAIELSHSPAHRAQKRQQAFKLAVMNAREKALSVAQMLEVQLGPALKVEEQSISTHDCKEIGDQADNSTVPVTNHPSSAYQSLHEQLSDSTHTYAAQVGVVFEVLPFRMCYHRKCPKH